MTIYGIPNPFLDREREGKKSSKKLNLNSLTSKIESAVKKPTLTKKVHHLFHRNKNVSFDLLFDIKINVPSIKLWHIRGR